jgi:hypothetical protein
VKSVDNDILVGLVGEAVTDIRAEEGCSAALDHDRIVPKGSVTPTSTTELCNSAARSAICSSGTPPSSTSASTTATSPSTRSSMATSAASTSVGSTAAMGVYGAIVQSPAYRDHKVRTVFNMLPALIGPDAQPFELHFNRRDGRPYNSAVLLLVSNNPYASLRDGRLAARARRGLDGSSAYPPPTSPAQCSSRWPPYGL